jgi:hypothetical protein
LKEGRDAAAVQRLAKHVYNAFEMFRREIEAARAMPGGGADGKETIE